MDNEQKQTGYEQFPVSTLEEHVTVSPEAPIITPMQAPTPAVHGQRHFLAAFFFSFLWGSFGVDRFYLGKIWTGLLKLMTFGGFGVWALIDFVLIMSGSMRDKQGQPMLEAARYKKFANRTILWFAISLGFIILVMGISLIFSVMQLITTFQNGGASSLQHLIPAGLVPDTSQLQGL